MQMKISSVTVGSFVGHVSVTRQCIRRPSLDTAIAVHACQEITASAGELDVLVSIARGEVSIVCIITQIDSNYLLNLVFHRMPCLQHYCLYYVISNKKVFGSLCYSIESSAIIVGVL